MPQQDNPELQDIQSTHFMEKYDASTSWLGVPSAWSMLMGLRGWWPYSSRDQNNDPYDLSEQGRTLTNQNAVTFGLRGLVPYSIHTQVATNYLERLDEAGIQITGPLTFGCWAYFDNLGSFEALMSKWVVAGNQRGYEINKNAANTISAVISLNGVALTTVTTVATVSTATWYFIVGRFIPNTSLDIYVDKVKASNVVAIPGAIFNTNADFYIGRQDAAYLDGRTALPFLCAYALPDSVIYNMYEFSKALFGKR